LTKKTFPQKEKQRKEKKRKRREGWLTTKELERGWVLGIWEGGRRRGEGTHTNLAPTSHGIVGGEPTFLQNSSILDPHLKHIILLPKIMSF
jgi:hypothetical protein